MLPGIMLLASRSCLRRRPGGLLLFVVLLAVPFLADHAAARTIVAGAGQQFATPGAAIAAARPGDTVHIVNGQYYDCAFVTQDHLTIEGDGAGAVLTDKTCGGKALLVISGRDDIVRNLTLQRARVPDGNGAGIRAEGGNLTIDHVRFIDNQDGVLAADSPTATIRVVDSDFIGNGVCQEGGGCAHGIYVDKVALLHIEKSRFSDTHDGHHIKSRAFRTELVGSTVEDGPDGTASYLVDVPNGGGLLVEGDTFEKGPHCSNHGAAIILGEEGVDRPTPEIIVRNNHFRNDMDRPTIFVRNVTATPVQMVDNVLVGQVRPLEGDASQH